MLKSSVNNSAGSSMKRRVQLPGDKAIDIHYNEKVYSPHYSSVDTIVLANFIAMPEDKVLDVSCGSGITGLSLKYLRPDIDLYMCDISPEAVQCAQENAIRLGLEAHIFQNNLLDDLSDKYGMIIANLPTYTTEDMKQELHGPDGSYFAHETDGLFLYRKLFEQSKDHLIRGGVLVCECQQKLQDDFVKLAYNKGYKVALKNDYGFVLHGK